MFESLKEKLSAALSKLSSKGKLSEADVDNALREIRRSLLEADVDFRVVKDLIAKVREKSITLDVLNSITANDRIAAVLYEELVNLMGKNVQGINISSKPPTVILMAGLQGSGKTTGTVKLAKHLKNSAHNPLVVACDLRRPAAIEQLRILAEASKIPFYGPENNKVNVLDVVKNSKIYADSHMNDVIILDTAGRLQIDEDLMTELKNIEKIIAPHEKLLVVDAMMGQEAVNVAKSFHELLNLTGLFLTKMDGDARGGSALAIRAVTGVPVKFIGVGEATDALEIYNPERLAGRIMGMGDLQGLVEKINSAGLNENLKEVTPGKLGKQFNLEMLLSQFEQIEKLGPIEKLAGMIPGFDRLNLKAENADVKILKHNKAIIQSMTPEERRNPKIIKGSRRRRIAQGSGTSVQQVNQLLAQYEQMKKLFKNFSGSRSGFGMGQKLRNLFGR